MERFELEELTRRQRSQIPLLTELGDLTNQLRQAMERRDEVSLQMLMNMREDPLHRLQEIDEGLRAYLLRMPQPDAVRARALLVGEDEPENEAEAALAAQAASCRRMLEKVRQADRQLNLQLCGNRSFYRLFRD